MIAEENFENLTDGKFTVYWKARVSLSTNFPVHVNVGKLVDKEILGLPLNFLLTYHVHAGNLENKGKISLLHEQ